MTVNMENLIGVMSIHFPSLPLTSMLPAILALFILSYVVPFFTMSILSCALYIFIVCCNLFWCTVSLSDLKGAFLNIIHYYYYYLFFVYSICDFCMNLEMVRLLCVCVCVSLSLSLSKGEINRCPKREKSNRDGYLWVSSQSVLERKEVK